MKIILKISVVIFLLSSACTPATVIAPALTPLPGIDVTSASATSLPTRTTVPSFTSTPTLRPFPTFDDGYYSPPTMFHLVYIKMFDERNGWGCIGIEVSTIINRLVQTSDGGKSWVDVTPVDRFGVPQIFFLDGQIAWARDVKWSETNKWWFLYFTKNGGRSWETLSVPLEGINSLYFTDTSMGWAEESTALYQTTDGGRTWNNFLASSPIESGKFLFLGTANIWTSNYSATASQFEYLYVTWDGGKTWEAKNMPFRDETFSDADLLRVNLPVFFEEELGYVTAQYHRQTEDEKTEYLIAVFVTNDGGHTWTQQSSVTQKLHTSDDVDFVSSTTAFVACDSGLCITRDGARTWQAVPLDVSQKNFFDDLQYFEIDFVSPTKGWLLGLNKTRKANEISTLYSTDDGGITWNPLPLQVSREE